MVTKGQNFKKYLTIVAKLIFKVNHVIHIVQNKKKNRNFITRSPVTNNKAVFMSVIKQLIFVYRY